MKLRRGNQIPFLQELGSAGHWVTRDNRFSISHDVEIDETIRKISWDKVVHFPLRRKKKNWKWKVEPTRHILAAEDYEKDLGKLKSLGLDVARFKTRKEALAALEMAIYSVESLKGFKS